MNVERIKLKFSIKPFSKGLRIPKAGGQSAAGNACRYYAFLPYCESYLMLAAGLERIKLKLLSVELKFSIKPFSKGLRIPKAGGQSAAGNACRYYAFLPYCESYLMLAAGLERIKLSLPRVQC